MEENANNVSETSVTPNEQPIATKTYTEEDVKRERQSASSKAKFDVLSELGISSVDEFKNLRTELASANEKYEQVNKLNEENKTKYNDLQSKFDNYKKESIAKQLGVDESSFNDFKTLVDSKVDAEHSFEDVAKEVAKKYFNQNATQMAVVPPTTQPVKKYNTYGW